MHITNILADDGHTETETCHKIKLRTHVNRKRSVQRNHTTLDKAGCCKERTEKSSTSITSDTES